MQKRTAIFIHGGGIKGSFAAGFVYGLSMLGIKNFDVICGNSSGSATATYVASRQFDYIRDIWNKEIPGKKIVHYFNLITGKPIFDTTYLINSVFKESYPLDTKEIFNSKNELIIPLCNYETRRIELFTSKQPLFAAEFWNILCAAMTLHDRQILHGTRWQPYVDADLDPFSLYRNEIIPSNYDVLIISNHHYLGNSLRKRIGLALFRALQSRNFPKGVQDMLRARNELIRSGIEDFDSFVRSNRSTVVSPAKDVRLGPLSVIRQNSRDIQALFDAGVQASKDMECDLYAFRMRSEELETSTIARR